MNRLGFYWGSMFPVTLDICLVLVWSGLGSAKLSLLAMVVPEISFLVTLGVCIVGFFLFCLEVYWSCLMVSFAVSRGSLCWSSSGFKRSLCDGNFGVMSGLSVLIRMGMC